MKHSAKAAARLARERARQAAMAGAGGARQPAVVQLPYALMLAGLVAGLALMVGGAGAVRTGTLVIAGAVLAGSAARLILPDGKAGMLGSRRRLIDVVLLTGLGVGLLVAGLILKVPG